MFTTKPAVRTDLDIVMDKIYTYLKDNEVNTDDYGKAIDNLIKLQKMKDTNPSRLSAETKAKIAANILGIFAVIGYERIHVVTTKALGLISKPQ